MKLEAVRERKVFAGLCNLRCNLGKREKRNGKVRRSLVDIEKGDSSLRIVNGMTKIFVLLRTTFCFLHLQNQSPTFSILLNRLSTPNFFLSCHCLKKKVLVQV